MTIRLFHSPASPYVRKVMIAAHERGVIDQIELLASAAGPVKRDMNIVRHNSTGKVPCALTKDDTPVFDSRVICQLIDHMGAPGASLYGDTASRIRILTLEALGDAILDACLLCRYEDVMRPAELRWEDWYAGQMAKVDSGLDDLEGYWFDDLTGPFHAGAIAAASVLGYLDFRFPDKDWRATHPKLKDWFAKVSKRDSVIATMPSG
ncbi:glutathione S-transferase family protein [Paracoccus xiamenensis]|uniref:glutathione S-transferase family protein n=1 Tax=Paracoccus xiamenensis TaxID=2714901 RepID=UPI00140DF5AE|nr:glutathione S-transferase family protein [Paracoccus xiamenensis]NHF74445.1 glutathione S-transferase family protein [Paracoccus xiamenensis]